jgi:hypothetical protein
MIVEFITYIKVKFMITAKNKKKNQRGGIADLLL